jgi:hypothetical protein
MHDALSSIVAIGTEIKRLSCEKGCVHNCGMPLDLAPRVFRSLTGFVVLYTFSRL